MKISHVMFGAGLITSALSSNVLANENGVVNFSGSVISASCEVPAAQMTRDIQLDGLTSARITNAATGSSVTNVPFRFDVTGCPSNINQVGIQFDFTEDGQYMSNTGTGTGVAFGITDASDTQKRTGEAVYATNVDSVAGTATVNAKLHAYRLAEAVAAGTITSTATVTLVSN